MLNRSITFIATLSAVVFLASAAPKEASADKFTRPTKEILALINGIIDDSIAACGDRNQGFQLPPKAAGGGFISVNPCEVSGLACDNTTCQEKPDLPMCSIHGTFNIEIGGLGDVQIIVSGTVETKKNYTATHDHQNICSVAGKCSKTFPSWYVVLDASVKATFHVAGFGFACNLDLSAEVFSFSYAEISNHNPADDEGRECRPAVGDDCEELADMCLENPELPVCAMCVFI